MANYRKILVAIDLTDEALQVLDRALAIAKNHGAELMLVHVIEPVGYAYGGDIPMDLTDLQTQLDEKARAELEIYGEKYGIGKENQHVLVGRPEAEVHRLAEEDKEIDLVVVGSHGRHGIQLLLGSTANGILHGATCDVLAVRIM
ncbi:universal stress protein [Hydrocarboniclastica marina]|uniref:Universal stress protein n=1 Tax=Hydrocarboniclastica marina TaxID=2259620 RepID=A0A4P7XJ54_9ALTE|nr:universal stress protein [Hydrocarboniclastica marina]MAL98346.1 universal stress protein UspA [Alteromonadaceae bacterium]QCF25887.1 universal stress protein [Hydrocarboniclastica marina]|tara:strand:- start:1745 stop:2179 length:435 start_codon:yes stop_codon:yes gene_type:complete